MTTIPQDILDHFGDFRWWTRPDVFSHPQCAQLVPSVDEAIVQLRKVYDADTCRELICTGSGALVVIFFLDAAFTPGVDDLLQLGADLSLCDGWETRPRFVGSLRTPRGWAAARFEAGVNAGLVRVGIRPIVEPRISKSDVTPDFVVDCDGLRVAIELKGIHAPNYERNRSAVCDVLCNFLWHRTHHWRGDVTLTLDQAAVKRLEMQHEQFIRDELPSISAELEVACDQLRLNTRTTLPTLGEIVVAFPPAHAGESYAGGCLVSPSGLEPEHLLIRALRTARECSKELGAVPADLRIAVEERCLPIARHAQRKRPSPMSESPGSRRHWIGSFF